MQFTGITFNHDVIRDPYGSMKRIPNNFPRFTQVRVFFNEITGEIVKVVPLEKPDPVQPEERETEVVSTDSLLSWDIEAER